MAFCSSCSLLSKNTAFVSDTRRRVPHAIAATLRTRDPADSDREAVPARRLDEVEPGDHFRAGARDPERTRRHRILRCLHPGTGSPIERVSRVVGGLVANCQRLQPPPPLDEPENRRMVEERIRNEVSRGKG